MHRSLLYVVLAALLVVLAIPAVAYAQDTPVGRMVRAQEELQTVTPLATPDKALAGVGKTAATVTTEIAGQAYMSLWLDGDLNEAELKSLGVIIQTRFPNGIMTAQVPVAMYQKVSALPGMKRITAVHMAHKCLNYSTPSTQARPNYWTSSPPNFSGQAGAGVIIGDVDNGIDYKHLDFKNPDGTTRLLAIWDQNVTPSVNPPAGYTYGREYTPAEINANLPTVRDGADGHGSHVMGIAGGDGSATGNGQPGDVFIGMAPRADLIAVATLFTDAGIADGVNYIFAKAAAAGKSAVVNLSLGNGWGPHLGVEAFDTSIGSLTGAGKIVVCSAGNDGGQGVHALQHVPAGGGNKTVTFNIPTYTANALTSNDFVQLDCYYDETANMTVSITSPRGTSNVSNVTFGTYKSSTGTDGYVYMENGYTPSTSGLQNIFIQIYDGTTAKVPRVGNWTITLTPVSGTNPRLDCWNAASQLGALGVQPAFTGATLDEHCTVGSPAAGPNVIAVGAITDKNRWLSINGSTYVFSDTTAVGALTHWSSVGPLPDGTQKPDIATFGGGVMSTLSSAVTRNATNNVYIHPDGQHQIMSGTSMSSPMVAGGVALILADTPGLTPAQVKTKLYADALVDGQTGAVWNYQYGHGKLRMLRADTTPPTVTVNSPNGGENWAIGSSHNITWTATDNVAVTSISIDYSTNNGTSWTSVATGLANSGTYAWTIPATPTTQALVRVKAFDAATNNASDVSNAVFTISDQTAPAVTVNAPNGGETWIVGSGHNITWTATDLIGVTSIDIDYSTNNGASWTSVATGEANDGTYAWTIPNTPSTQALVRVKAYDAAANVGSDVSNAVFTIAASTHTIVASAGAGGSIDPSGNVPVNDGANQTFTITPGPCYNIADVLVNGSSVGAVPSYEFINVTADQTIAASFVLKTYTIAASVGGGGGGAIDPAGNVTVNCGANKTFTITPDPCYDIADVLVNGGSVGAVPSYEFTNVTANQTIVASFVLKTYTIAASVGGGGAIDPAGNVTVDCGANKTFTITPDPCYDIADVLVNGISVGAVPSYEFVNVTANATIAASFVHKTYTLDTAVIGGGSLIIAKKGSAIYDCGTSVEISALADPGWQFDHWTGSATGSDNPLTVIMDGDKSITAVFVDIAPPEVTLTSPNGGEVWNYGENQPITWTATDNVGVTAVDLAYSTDGGATYPNVIATGLANTGSYLWAVPNDATLTARVRVTAHDAAALSTSDDSDANFEIAVPLEAVADVLLGPGEVLGVYPNPAYSGANVLYRIPQATSVDVSVYDVTGHMVRKIAFGAFPGGVRTLKWDGRDESGKPVSAGIYLVRLVAGSGAHQTKRLVLFR
jgi:subtilisin family serine protease